MTTISIQPPFPIFTDIDGQPLEDGFIQIGVANLDPVGNPITVYWDEALLVPAVQPIRTIGGYPMRSGAPARLYVNSDYSIRVSNKNGSVVYSAPTATERYSASDVSFTATGSGTVSRTVAQRLDDTVSVKDFGALGDGATDDTAAFQAAIDSVYAAGGGTIFIPEGTYRITSLVKNWAFAISVRLVGAGKTATVLQKIGLSTTPIINFSASVGTLDTYCSISDLKITGNVKTHHGLQLTRWARFDVSRVLIDNCDVAFENIGSLVFTVYDCAIQGNNIGYRCRKSAAGPIYCNLVQFIGGIISGNTTLGVDIGDASGVHFIGTDLSANGTAGNTATGAVLLRDTMDDETGFASFSMRGAWMEANYGWSFRTENATGLVMELHDVLIASSEAGRAASIGNVFSSCINGVVAGSVGDTVSIGAARSTVMNSVIGTLTDTSTAMRHLNVGTTAEQISDAFRGRFLRMKLATEDFLYGRSDNISGGSSDSIDFYLYGSGRQNFFVGGVQSMALGAAAIGFYSTAPQTKRTVTGAKGGNAALTSLLSALSTIGLITDSTT